MLYSLNKGESFMFLRAHVEAHVDDPDWSEWQKCCFYCLFPQFKRNTAYVNSTHETERLLSLNLSSLMDYALLLMRRRLFH